MKYNFGIAFANFANFLKTTALRLWLLSDSRSVGYRRQNRTSIRFLFLRVDVGEVGENCVILWWKNGIEMKKITFVLLTFALVAFLVSCRISNPCRGRGAISSQTRVNLFDFPELPESAKLYVYRRNNGFVRAIRSVEYERIRAHNRTTIIREDADRNQFQSEVIQFNFPQRFLKNRDYRIVINDTIFFDVSDLVFGAQAAGGIHRFCVTFGMKINGKPLCETYLPAFRINLPYSMGRIVHND